MSQPREPVRWADPASESDPLLRGLIGRARAEVGDTPLAARIEQAVHARVAADSGGLGGTATRHWWPWVGVAALCMTFGGAALGLRSDTPETSGDAATAPEMRAADSGARSASAIAAGTTVRRASETAAVSDGVRSSSAALPATLSGEPARRLVQQPNVGRVDPKRIRTRDDRVEQLTRADRERSNRRAQTPRAGTAGELDDMRSTRTARSNLGTARKHVASRDAEDHAGDDIHEASTAQPSAAANPVISGVVSPSLAPDQSAVPPELTLISAAQRALRHSPKEALALTEQHARAYPNGGFKEEREEIAISALFALGQQTAARTRAQTFLSQHPRALSAPRIQKLLDTLRSPQPT